VPGRRVQGAVRYAIDQAKCDGCHACVTACSTGAITGQVKYPHLLNQDLCIKCGACIDACKREAVLRRDARSLMAGGRDEARDVTIDGIKTEAEDRTPLIQVAQKAGVKIPDALPPPAVEPYGVCRICTVEVHMRGRVRLVTACNYPSRTASRCSPGRTGCGARGS